MKVKNVIKSVEQKLSVKAKILIGLGILALGVHFVVDMYHPNDMTLSSVKVIRFDGRSGGSGVIIESGAYGSSILTNSHVCNVIKGGGTIESRHGSHLIASYQPSEFHDLCLIHVKSNLGINTKIASSAPVTFYEKAFISGHPNLLPNVVTSGHYSSKMIISVLTGFKPCKEGQESLFCTLTGMMPVIRLYESSLVTATIMPGSSGSGVFNSSLELSGLAFAGSKDFGYAWTVPYEDMISFLEVESKTAARYYPSLLDVNSSADEENKQNMEKLKEACEKEPHEGEMKDICGSLKNRDLLWRM